MYESFFGLTERPFDLSPNPRYLVMTEAHREALSNLDYAVASRKGVTLLLGEAGTGKTTVIRAALERQPEQTHCVHLQNPALNRSEFVEMLATRFGLTQHATASKAALLLELEALLASRRDRDESTVLIIDEAQSLPLDLLEEIRLLANIETNHDKLVSVILAGQPELADRLNERSLRQLKQRIALRCELRALTLRESSAYIAGRIRAAGGSGAQTFTREAVMLMHERAAGIPRTLNVIADNALLTGFAVSQRPVTAKLVLEVCRDLDLTGEAVPVAMTPAIDPSPPALPAPIESGRLITFASAPPATREAADAEAQAATNGAPARRRRFSIF
jgi:type II secretory pathway predicted ATPase ExeA